MLQNCVNKKASANSAVHFSCVERECKLLESSYNFHTIRVISLGKLHWTLHRKRIPLFSSGGRKSLFTVNITDSIPWSLQHPDIKSSSLSYSCPHYSELLRRTQLSFCLSFFWAAPHSWEHCSGSSQWCSLWPACHFCALLSLLPVVECWIKCRFLLLAFEVLVLLEVCL